ncbi:hypothetical protein J1N35_044383 [Gossypium stocksii]|uniref:Uncharacterized protein n=1 Tax=Gossypium stocksii TaxID=47602 RepID=A0A9D3ZFQ1_9ROSI|nr:hypothetical protein J1N35_044383 [Gossypium stocksii]
MVVEMTDSLSKAKKLKVMENEGKGLVQHGAAVLDLPLSHHCGAHKRDVFDEMKMLMTRQILSFMLALMG